MSSKPALKSRDARWLRARALLVGTSLLGTLPLAAAEAPTASPQDAAPPPSKPAEAKAPAETAASAEPKAETEAVDEESLAAKYRNWIDLSVGGLSLDGDKAQFGSRHALKTSPFGGIEDFHWETQVKEKSFFEADGRAIFDNSDYLLRLELVRPDFGFLRGGFKEFRTWYDGTGGFLPQSGTWFSLYDDDLYLDRGEFWVETGLNLPDRPSVTLKYSHQFRDGTKDSTSWGDASITGGPLGIRGIAPSFWNIDERRDTVQADIRHKLGKTDLGLRVLYEYLDQDNSRNMRRRPGEAADRHVTQKDGVQSDLFNVYASSQTKFNERLWLTSGYAFSTLDTDLSGSRVYGSDYEAVYDPMFARRQYLDAGFLDLSGGSQLYQHVAHLNLMTTPWENFRITPSVRFESLNTDSLAQYTGTQVLAPSGSTAESLMQAASDRAAIDVSERLEARYVGVTNWVFYARGDWTQGQGDLAETQLDLGAGALGLYRDTDDTRLSQKYTAGVNWYPLRQVNFDLQYYHKIRNNDYDHLSDTTDPTTFDGYPAFIELQDFTTDDANFRLTLRPLNNLTLVSRYDLQYSTIHQASTGLGTPESAELRSHIFAQSVTWIPWTRLFLQASGNYAFDKNYSPAAELNGAILNAENGYWNASFTAGFILDNKTDLQTHYFYYLADDYHDNSAVGVPYGAGAEEHGVTVTLNRRLSERLRWTLKYGFFTNDDETYGGLNDYDAHLVYSAIHYRF